MQKHTCKVALMKQVFLKFLKTRISPDISTCQLAFHMRYQGVTVRQVEIRAVQVWVISCLPQCTDLFKDIRLLSQTRSITSQLFSPTAAQYFVTCCGRGLVHIQPRGAVLK